MDEKHLGGAPPEGQEVEDLASTGVSKEIPTPCAEETQEDDEDGLTASEQPAEATELLDLTGV